MPQKPTVALLAWLGVAVSPLLGQRPPEGDSLAHVVASGVGVITLSADRAVLRFSIVTRGESAAAASAANNRQVRRVLDSLGAIQQAPESLQLVAVEVRPAQNYQTQAITGYEASAVVRLVIRDLDRLGLYLDRGLSSGATGVGGISFTSDRAAVAKQEAIGLAFNEALAKAQAVARAAGVRLGALLGISVLPDDFYSSAFEQSGVDVQSMSRAAAITPQGVLVRATVTARWELQRP